VSDTLDVSLRASRVGGILDHDKLPEINDLVQAFVISTTKKGCFLRLSQFVEGRVLLKDLSDSFIHDPISQFPPGRLVVGRVRAVHDMKNSKKAKKFGAVIKRVVDLNMRESVILEDQNKLRFDDIKEGQKYRGIVTRIESFGVFVRFDNSDVSGLAHLSECSDDYIKNLHALYDPGDLVKALVLKVDVDLKRVALSLKASHFEDDSERSGSDDESIDLDHSSQDEIESSSDDVVMNFLDSDDDIYVSRPNAHISNGPEGEGDESDVDYDEESDVDDEDDISEKSGLATDNVNTMDTDVGFDWGDQDMKSRNDVDDSQSDEEADDSDGESSTSYSDKNTRSSRKKVLDKLQEEKEVSSKELRIASGAADENPETISDFERLLVSNPDSSEIWIRYMAFHLSLADIDSARLIANRALDRIEFRREGEKLNVWTALLTLELKYGTYDSFRGVLERSTQQNNPKQIYLRACELLERELDDTQKHSARSQESLSMLSRTNEIFSKMVRKFKTKKTVWIAYTKYLLKSGRHDEAHDAIKRAMSSLPSYKHIETMCKFAQLEYEHGFRERARTMFEALLDKYPKRLDILFVFVDKEVKYGDTGSFRKIFERAITCRIGDQKVRYNDKQMKSLFKKWYTLEDLHGDEKTRQHVKYEAKRFVENSMKTDV
jgi:rRNA biogenesis protein RRP5